MTDIRHHLTDALLLGYSAGTLPEAFSLAVATHISVCDECRARLGAFDAVGGSLLDDSHAAPMASGTLDAALAAIRQTVPEARPAMAGTPARSGTTSGTGSGTTPLPAPLSEYIGADTDAIRWRRIGGGVSQAVIRTDGSATARLLRIPAGAAVPDHGHHGMELTLVLQGAFDDGHDSFGPGDIEVAGEDTHHKPVAAPGDDCICLAVTDAPLRFSGIIPRIAQRVLRI